ncbi:PWI domain-containing protein [Flagelloscypha sp. PMI_526]|nr:PWI domain-containing protein [Flagelloscypha sp. PMI_526]
MLLPSQFIRFIGFFKGTSADQDRRFSDKDMKLLRTMKFPPEFDQKVDMRKVNLPVIRPWIAKKIVAICGFEDEIVIEYANSLLEDESQKSPDPRKIQIYLTNFLTKDAPAFVLDLWKLLLEAQADVTGVPRTFVEEKKEEMRKARANDSRAFEERDRRGGNTSGNTNRLEELMKLDQELKEGRGRGRGRGFGGRGRGGGGRGRGGYGGGGYDDSPRSRDGGWGNRGGGVSSCSRSPIRTDSEYII